MTLFSKKRNNSKIETQTNGFTIYQDNLDIEIIWENIITITAYKKDLITTDELCLEINTNSKSVVISEEFIGWETFILKLQNHFPSIPNDWLSQLIKPAFKENKTTIFKKA